VPGPAAPLGPEALWRTGVVRTRPADLAAAIYRPRTTLPPATRILALGSCFSHHIFRVLSARGLAIDAEPAPPGTDAAVAARFGYGQFSARTGFVPTARQILRLIEEAEGSFRPAHPVWSRDGRFFDALRPGTEPEGMESAGAVAASRADHLARLRSALAEAGALVLTLAETEAWEDAESGTVYPTAPGAAADPPPGHRIGAVTADVGAVTADLRALLSRLRRRRPGLRAILAVSPVPPAATASGDHILTSASLQKATLRAAVAAVVAADPLADYFPAFEIVTNPAARSATFGPGLRYPTPAAVRSMTGAFLAAHGLTAPHRPPRKVASKAPAADPGDDGLICEEKFLDPRA
jgi:hypothetical protein